MVLSSGRILEVIAADQPHDHEERLISTGTSWRPTQSAHFTRPSTPVITGLTLSCFTFSPSSSVFQSFLSHYTAGLQRSLPIVALGGRRPR